MPGGPGVSSDYLRSFADPLLDRLTWYLVDPPGTGESDPASDYSIGSTARFYREVADALGLERTLVFGHSYSGTVASTFAERYPEVTLGCLLVAPPVVGTDVDEAEGGAIRAAMNAAMERHAGEEWYKEAVEAEFNPDPDDPAGSMLRGLPLYFSAPDETLMVRVVAALTPIEINMEPMMWFYEREWAALDLRPIIEDLAAPILAIVGEHDWAVPPIQARFYQAAPNSRVVTVPECGHFVPLEKPNDYRSAVGDWLEGLD